MRHLSGVLLLFVSAKLPLSRRLRRAGKRLRLRVTTSIGSDRYTWAALHDMDRRLAKLFDYRERGRFLEIGANDGLQQSNTLALETLYGWRGVLVEAHPELAHECSRNRPLASVVCAAAAAEPQLTTISDGDLHGATATGHGMTVSAVPLSGIIEHFGSPALDLVVIDVEGGELSVLAGFDLERHGPRFLLIETADVAAVEQVVEPLYRRVAQWSHHDYVFARR